MSIIETFKNNFEKIIEENNYYNNIFRFLYTYNNNSLLYGAYGFPTDFFIDLVIKKKFNLTNINKKECIWNKDLPYLYNQHFLEIDLLNPSVLKYKSQLAEFILNVIKNKNINNEKHLIIIKHLDKLSNDEFSSFRIILEKYSSNSYFICTTHKLDKIDAPIKSRFALLRMPLFYHNDIIHIFDNILKIPLNKYLIKDKSRNIIKALFLVEIERINPDLITNNFSSLNFPLVDDFCKNHKKNITDIRQFSYKCFQNNISISNLLLDILKYLPSNKKQYAIKIASEYDHYLNLTNLGKETIYIEGLLCKIFL